MRWLGRKNLTKKNSSGNDLKGEKVAQITFLTPGAPPPLGGPGEGGIKKLDKKISSGNGLKRLLAF